MRRPRLTLLTLVVLFVFLFLVTSSYLELQTSHTQLLAKLTAQAATWQQERGKRDDVIGKLQEKLGDSQRRLEEATTSLEKRGRQAESVKEELAVTSARLEEARQQRDLLTLEMKENLERIEEVEARLGDCEEAREKCVKGEFGKRDAKEMLLDELKTQNERLAAKSQELQVKVVQLQENCEQTHRKSEGLSFCSKLHFF